MENFIFCAFFFLPCPFFKIEESALIFEKKYPDRVHLWVKSSIQNVVLRVSRRKSAKCSPAGPFFLVLFTKCLSKCPSSTKHLLPGKISGWVPTLRHYSFCKTLHLKCLTVFWICLSLQLLSNLYSDLMLCTASDTFRILVYLELCIFRYMQAYSSIFRIIKAYSRILRHY